MIEPYMELKARELDRLCSRLKICNIYFLQPTPTGGLYQLCLNPRDAPAHIHATDAKDLGDAPATVPLH